MTLDIEPSFVHETAEEAPEKSFKKFNPNAAPYFKPTTTFVPQVEATPATTKNKLQDLSELDLNNEFTPSTPYVHKFRTEICKNFELHGWCKFGDEVS